MIIYHITYATDWELGLTQGFYTAPSLQAEGFIHCSLDNQVQGVLERYYAGETNLVKLVIDTDKLDHQPKFELAPSVNEDFPHIYGPINLNAVTEAVHLDKGE